MQGSDETSSFVVRWPPRGREVDPNVGGSVMKISLGVLLGVSFGVVGATTVASAQDPFAQDTVIDP